MKFRVKIAAILAMAIGIPVLIGSTTPASAAGKAEYCRLLMSSMGYSVGPKVTDACNYAGTMTCYSKLRLLGVNANDASFACQI
ncbi:hypothetical protein FDA94_25010 [Herbidospora galbida]|uniref:Uncharacterized protein n=1 Tax=Herbidospora galbida TaxID=2575442 RepID=A0A4V6XBC7_9ACTN|nr:hypothetical protein [Herbidospora galbida]TKK85653.1 hypothetical protein FDA94_25010 [Herbidospora galbida]